MTWQDDFADRITRDAELAPLVTVRIGGKARELVAPHDDAEVGALITALVSAGRSWRVLGGGSNVLPPDGVIDDVVIHPVAMDGFEVAGDRVHVGAGLPTPRLVNLCSQAGLSGVHVLAGVPGQVGGAIAMNAGTRHGWIDETVERVHVRLRDGASATLDNADLSFGYRHAVLPEGAVITGATLKLSPADDPAALRRTVGAYLKEKNAAQPTRTWNFGCMFKNAEEATAGRLLDAAGMKGVQRGGARSSRGSERYARTSSRTSRTHRPRTCDGFSKKRHGESSPPQGSASSAKCACGEVRAGRGPSGLRGRLIPAYHQMLGSLGLVALSAVAVSKPLP